MAKQVLVTPGIYPSKGYSQAIRVGNTIYLAGIVGMDEKGNIDKTNAGAQAKQIWANMEKILKHQGGSLQDIVEITTYITRKEDHIAVRDARRAAWTKDPQPTATLVVCSALASPDLLVEINGTAVLDK